MPGFREALVNTVRQGFCTVLGVNAQLQEYFSNFVVVQPDFSADAARGLYNLACDRTPEPDPVNPPPFLGGQCPVPYNVFYDSQLAPVDGENFPPSGERLSGTYLGRIGGVRFSPDGLIFQVLVEADTNPTWINVAVAGTPWNQESTRITRVQRVDGLPDDCGNLPGDGEVVVPPDYNSIDIDVDYTNNDGIDVSAPVSFVYLNPQLNVRGEVIVPVDINFNDPLIEVPISLRGNFNLSTGGITFGDPTNATPTGDRNLPRDATKDEPLPEPNPGDGDNTDPTPDEPPEETRTIRGAIVVVSSYPDGEYTTIFRDRTPNIVLPDLGQVSFKIEVGGDFIWSTFQRINYTRQFVVCEWYMGAVEVVFEARPGVTGVAVPVYAVTDGVVVREQE